MICSRCAYRKWYWAGRDAARRGVPFLLTFRAWFAIWKGSGHWHKRGLKKGQYVMGRYNDVGPYDIGNVKIITNLENTLESNLGRKHTPEACANMGKHRLGKHHTAEARARIRESNLRTYADPAVRKKAANGHRGWSERRKVKLLELQSG